VNGVPEIRIRKANEAAVRESGKYVLYWMIASRRLRHNCALDRAREHCRELRKPLAIFEALRAGYQWASDRIHSFLLQGHGREPTRLRGAWRDVLAL
jgi:deoxyribodipyrimidine photo-lyase